MEIRIREDRCFGFVVSAWLHGEAVGLRIDYGHSEVEVQFSWRCPNDENCSRECVTIENIESLAEIDVILEDHFSHHEEDLRYLIPLVNEAFLVAMDQGYFDHLDEELVEGLTRCIGYDRSWFTCYGFLVLDLSLGVMELLVPPILIGPDLPVHLQY